MSCLDILDDIAEQKTANSKSAVTVFYEKACPGVLDSKFNVNKNDNTVNDSTATEGSETNNTVEVASEFDIVDLNGDDAAGLNDSTSSTSSDGAKIEGVSKDCGEAVLTQVEILLGLVNCEEVEEAAAKERERIENLAGQDQAQTETEDEE